MRNIFWLPGRRHRARALPRIFFSVAAFAVATLCVAEVSWNQEPGHRWRVLDVPSGGSPGFTRLDAAETGIHFTNALTDQDGAANRVLYNGSGVAVGDFNGNGLPDLYFCGLNSSNVLYQNLGGWRFKPVTAEAGVESRGPFDRGAVFADINGNGHLDLLITTLNRGVRCFINLGDGRFVDRTAEAGTASTFGASTLALADVDGDGSLDLYVTHYRTDDIRDRGEVSLQVVGGQIQPLPEFRDRLVVVDGVLLEYGEPDQLLLNDGHGRFKPVSWTGGAFLDEAGRPLKQAPRDWGLTATFRDVNGNGLPDIYVCNDYWTPDRFWINQGQGRFRAIDRLALRSTSASSMGLDFADINRNGHLDAFVLDMLSRDHRLRKRQKIAQPQALAPIGTFDDRPQLMRNTLLENRGDGTYREVAWNAGVQASDWSWSVVFLDVDLDGYEDLLIAAGHFKDVQDMDATMLIQTRQRPRDRSLPAAERLRQFQQELLEHHQLYPRLEMPIIAFRNRGDGTFEEMTEAWGFHELGVHHSIAYGDFDQDGDLDLVVNRLDGSAGVYRNNSSAPRVAVRLRGLPPNTQGIGAHVRFLGGAVPMQLQEVVAGGRYLAGAEPLLVFASGNDRQDMTIEVRWRSGRRSVVTGVQPNRIYEIEETGAQPARDSTPPTLPPPLFQDLSPRIAHRHHELPFDDFARQPLLPFRLSQQGPGLAWFDLDGDGNQDLVVGAGRGGSLRVHLGDGRGGFRVVQSAPDWIAPDDLTACLGWYPQPNQPALLVGVSGYEVPGSAAVLSVTLEGNRLRMQPALDDPPPVIGPLALGSLEGNGNLALFVGCGSLPGLYPTAGASAIYRQAGHRWVRDEVNSKAVADAGIVNAALWSDLDGDGWPELLLACEWGPIRVYQNEQGRLTEITQTLGLDSHIGWWRGITTGDLNGNGRLDIIASNWGLNSPFQASPERPLRLVYGDFLDGDRYDLIETEYDPQTSVVVPARDFNALSPSLPFLYEHYRSFRQFSETTVTQMLGEYLVKARESTATTLASTIFYNDWPILRPVPLPRPAQLAPAFAVAVLDLDGNGHEDIFLSQNFFATRLELPRLDAGRSLWLRADGPERWSEVDGQTSGLLVYGEQRAAAFADFDGDGRVDIAISQNGAETKLYRNQGATPGLRVRLVGPDSNPAAFGTLLRLRLTDGLGPAREVRANSGYWSQDATVQVLHAEKPITGIWIRWPGGKIQSREVTPDEREIELNYSKISD
jgi:enediyne biosynthesis protein E4